MARLAPIERGPWVSVPRDPFPGSDPVSQGFRSLSTSRYDADRESKPCAHPTSAARESAISGPISDPRPTPLHAQHRSLRARLVDFAGWSMPVQYDGLIKEHERVRRAAGLFDVSHMGELVFRGSGALATLNHLATNDVAQLEDGQVLYTPLCNADGGVRDDVLVYRLTAEEFMLVVNAANTEKIRAWCEEHLQPRTSMEDHTEEWALLALQGPQSAAILGRSKLLGMLASQIEALGYYRFLRGDGDVHFVSRTGYTGERGYEIYLQARRAADLWEELFRLGADFGLGPAGLGARDTLRFEAAYCLYGNELAEDISPLEAGLAWTVKWKKGDFIGRQALLHQKENGIPRRLVGLEVQDRVIARTGFEVRREAECVGKVTSGTFSPTLGKSLALALVDSEVVEQPLQLVVRGREVPVRRLPLPFYKSKSNV